MAPPRDKDDDEDDKPEKETGEGSEKRWWAEVVRDLTATGLATIFMTEDSVRSYIKEKKLPKELIAPLLEGFSKKKDDFYTLAAKEVGRVLSKIDISTEVGRFLEKHKIHFEAKVSFEPKPEKEKKDKA